MTETTETVRLQRVPKGPKPQYFADPATDKLLTMVLELIGELSVARDRIDTLERLIEQAGLFTMADVDTYLPDEAVNTQRAERRARMLSRVFRASEKELDTIMDKVAEQEIETALD
ncbi:MAG TPA: hypothetical protein VN222_12295 [Novosphingobium sp.]|nr:hypothetical protein [Novosphingobium sp.]